MKTFIKSILLGLFLMTPVFSFSQAPSIEFKPENEKKFAPYMAVRHGGPDGLAELKKNNMNQYLKELWYYSESFYIKRDQLNEGTSMVDAMFDISRFEIYRKETEEAIVPL